ncbi:aconitase X catalytic domain-containing protein [Candidatus Bathyarchaeota archaeon]|nr:aconitase X catalytic domain-containing protein [Candidatus Bathyarchaeota archaeon]
MYLTKEEERIYDGERGWTNQMCMRILVRLGELFNAAKLVRISSAHVSGVSYKTLGDAPAEFLEALANAGGNVKVRATLNPQSLDTEYLGRKLEQSLREKQSNILKQFERMGFTESLTCTPYYLKKPKRDSHLAWAESSAVVYTNSVIGAWTNREGGPSALAAAIIGKTPDYGIHKPENRQPKALVTVDTALKNPTEFGALGIYLGRLLRDGIPAIQGLGNTSENCLKQLSAALASTGMVNMFHFKRKSQAKTERLEKVCVEARDIKNTVESLSTREVSKPDLVFIGCPHCSLGEIKKIALLMKDKKVNKETEFWVCTSHYIKEKAGEYVAQIEKNGGHVLAGVCTIVSWTEKLGIRTIMTNSAKTAYYAPTMNKAEVTFRPLKECLTTALRG